ncbi:DUF4167 domain-containing protein [Breoghania corrubedonensis]|nr:DUF4167 domain-containing protein [Breoghania corrubedonensis]
MRQNNQNKRLRGRGRKGPNPLTRSFESNGPDVKIRGTAMHIAEKYQQLARDAMVSGDRIMAENYLQHAEHYSRIVAAAQPQTNGQVPQSRSFGDNDEDDDESDEQSVETPPVAAKPRIMPEDAPQPFVDRMPGIDAKAGNGAGERPARGEANGEDKEEAAEKPKAKAPARTPRRSAAKPAVKDSAKEKGAPAENAEATASAESGAAESGSGEEGDEPARPRRRARGTRGRNVRRSASSGDAESGSNDSPATEPSEA